LILKTFREHLQYALFVIYLSLFNLHFEIEDFLLQHSAAEIN